MIVAQHQFERLLEQTPLEPEELKIALSNAEIEVVQGCTHCGSTLYTTTYTASPAQAAQ